MLLTVLTTQAYVFWPNATVPFFIDTEQFDNEQAISIMTALSLFAFKTCLKFAPVMARPRDVDHVLLLENPTGVRKCTINTEPHSTEEPHKVTVGYDCLKSPEIDMLLMKALGFPFEHNRAVRDLYIDVQPENVEPAYLDLFTKDLRLPVELRSIPYDPNSVMHFGEREFSKNGHRTIMFKDRSFRQERYGLSSLDLRKIDVVYGPECRKRDRQEKIELCQNYPGVARRKRDITSIPRSLRVNPDITPPPDIVANNASVFRSEDDAEKVGYADTVVKELGIEKEVEDLIEQVHKVAGAALLKARERYCNGTKDALRTAPEMEKPKNKNILGIIDDTASYAKSLVEKALTNLTEFCESSKSIDDYQRAACPFFNPNKCRQTYRSTKSGAVKFSTQHRPLIRQSTKHKGSVSKNIYESWYRSGNNTEEPELLATSTVQESDGTTPALKGQKKREAVSKSDLRMGTRVILEKKAVYAPRYRASNDTSKAGEPLEAEIAETVAVTVAAGETITDKVRRKRDTEQSASETVTPSTAAATLAKEAEPSTESASKKVQLIVSNDVKPDEAAVKIPVIAKLKYEGENDKSQKSTKIVKRRFENQRFRSKKGLKQQPEKEWEDSQMSLEMTTRKAKKAQMHPGLQAPSPSRGKKRRPLPEPSEEKVADNEEIPFPPLDPLENLEEPPPKPPKPAKQRPSHGKQQRKQKHERDSSRLPRTVALSKANREFYDERKWPGGIVRYVIKENGDSDIEDVRRRLGEVNEILKAKTCTKLQEITEAETEDHEDYLVLDDSPDYVTGRVGGRQVFGVVELLKGGQHRQHGAMMVMAMLGFYFEVSRHDRDKYIRVHMRHVRPDKLHHFEKVRADATFPLPYDYDSATHPAWQFWRQIGKTGISTVATFKTMDPDGSIMKKLGQNEQLLSDLDLVKINSVYGVKCFQRGDPGVKDQGRGVEAAEENDE